MTVTTDDLVVLLDEQRQPVGTAPRLSVHSAVTPLHLAFSCYLFSPAGEVLITRRALRKKTWPGVWTNSCCGHPRPGEAMEAAIARRLGDELNLEADGVRCVLPDFEYRAVDASGLVEHEFCPVYVGYCDPVVTPNPVEVAEFAWTPWSSLLAVNRLTPWLISPWASQQITLLGERDHGPA